MNKNLGKTLRDEVTGFEGIAVAVVEYLNGCIQYCVKPKMTEIGKMPEGVYIDEGQLIDVATNSHIETAKEPGGPSMDTPKDNYR